jgi:hypothetical protein
LGLTEIKVTFLNAGSLIGLKNEPVRGCKRHPGEGASAMQETVSWGIPEE